MTPVFPPALPLLLGIRDGSTVRVWNGPPGFAEALSPLPPRAAHVDSSSRGIDVQVLFATKKVEAVEKLSAMNRGMSQAGWLWVCFTPEATDDASPSETFFRLAALELGLVDVRKLVLTADWVALKLKRAPRGPRASPPGGRASLATAKACYLARAGVRCKGITAFDGLVRRRRSASATFGALSP